MLQCGLDVRPAKVLLIPDKLSRNRIPQRPRNGAKKASRKFIGDNHLCKPSPDLL